MTQHTPSACRAAIAGIVAALCMASAAHADVVISSGATSNVSCTSGVCTPSAPNAVLNVGDLETLLASGNVKLAAAGEPVDVDIAAPLSWVSTNTLTLDSYHAINVQQPVAINGRGGLALITNDGGTGGQFAFLPGANVAFLNGSGSLAINGTAYTLVNDISTLASDIAANPNGSYALGANYDAAPDGTYTASPISTNLSGNFQGLGNTISNLTISSGEKKKYLALFAGLAAGATISNLVLDNATVTVSGNGAAAALLVVTNSGTLFGDHTAGTVTGALYASLGGLAGGNRGTILDSSSSANVSGGRKSGAGGLVAGNSLGGTISACFATGSVHLTRLTIQKPVAAGGLVGFSNNASISNSYAAGSVDGPGTDQDGGLVGEFQNTTVASSYSAGAVKGGANDHHGGFIGFYLTGSATDSYWDTTTSGNDKASGNNKKLNGITGLKSKQLQSGLPTGFDPTIWAESPSINNGLPYLIANPPQ